ncbi:hypothetical protein EYF80_001676 [Liparis tanakae]|uniref:Uncharacterized protein n=1 Tax=Liparis tanakae TaxID=230148 RepID=A0A4Z2JCS0_9TELE|nr:hypothetical protein EYF80_001676 [Liparis tanakae]
MSTGGGFRGIWPRVNLFALNWASSSGLKLLSCENRLFCAAPAGPTPAAGGASVFPNPPLVCPKILPSPTEAGTAAPKPLPNPPPVAFCVEGKLNPEAEPNPEVAAGLLVDGAAKEKEEAFGAEEAAVEEPNPEGGCVGAAKALPKPGAAREPNPPLGAAKLKVLEAAVVPATSSSSSFAPVIPSSSISSSTPISSSTSSLTPFLSSMRGER